uniref:Polycystin cation channel PKD1/PKD2 domain-containing protein n=1 Tax=Eutreptiella gymnastica TaxID=73025 RepID=A0A7S1N9G3_9EUGL|mmetsp:Transcript_140945/g.245646  ORF Transcript_140945/g.245646 Transcript_140945/m.245646 type:complete len:807 (+) Transcript_140945:149-2569(+)
MDDSDFKEEIDRFGPISRAGMESQAKDYIMAMQTRKVNMARTFVIEFLLYIAFLIVFLIVTYNFRSSWAYWSSESIRNGVLRQGADNGFGIDFDGIGDVSQFWLYFEQGFFPNFYPENYQCSGTPLSSYDQKFTAQDNYRIGSLRFRQVRIQASDDCPVDPALSGYISSCYPTMQDATESTQSFGPANSAAWIWRDTEQLCGEQKERSYCGSLGATGQRSENVYPASGFAWDFANNYTTAMAELKSLKDNTWVDASTRVVVVEFTLFNPNVLLILAGRMIVEFYPTGQLLPSSSIKPIPVYSFEVTEHVVEFIGELLLGVFILGYFIRELHELYQHTQKAKKHCALCVKQLVQKSTNSGQHQPNEITQVECYICARNFDPFTMLHCPLCQREVEVDAHICWKGYFQDFWNVIDIINLVFFFAVLILRMVVRFKLMDFDYDVGNGFLNLYPLAWDYYMATWLNAFNSLLSFIKVFKYLSRSKSLRTCLMTLAEARGQLIYFVLTFMIVFCGFVMSFHMAFGGEVPSFSHWTNSIFTLWNALMGDFDYYEMQRSNRVLAPIFYFSFVAFVFLVLLNMFVAIVVGSYDTVADEVETSGDDFVSSSMKLFFREVRMKYFGWLLGKNNKLFRVHRLLTAIEKVPSLTERQKEEVRSLRREIDHKVNVDGLLAKILKELPNRPDLIPCNYSDFIVLRQVVQNYKQYSHHERYKKSAFEEDEFDAFQQLIADQTAAAGGANGASMNNLRNAGLQDFNIIALAQRIQRQEEVLSANMANMLRLLGFGDNLDAGSITTNSDRLSSLVRPSLRMGR